MADAKLDPAKWRAIRDGGARRLSEALEQADAGEEQAERILTTYLALSADALEQGFLRWGDDSAANVFTHAWLELVPDSMRSVAPAERTSLLSAPWEILDRLSRAPGWMDSLLLALARQVDSIGALVALAEDVLPRALKPPSRSLESGARPRRLTIPSTALAAHFLAPAVACIHAADGTWGAWLDAKPLLFRLQECTESPPAARLLPASLPQQLPDEDIEVGIANGWRALAIARGECWMWLPV